MKPFEHHINNGFKVLLTLILSIVVFAPGFTQGVSSEFGGTTDIFDFPVGARALAMGGAYVTVADGPFALYWNPAALENVPSVGLGFYHTNLPLGTQYDFLSFVYPTLNYGTFSAGLLRLATGGIKITDVDASYLGTQDYARNLYLVGYGKKLYPWLCIGATAKIEYSTFPGSQDELTGGLGTYSESAVGGDVGLLLSSPWESTLLRDWLMGFNYQNAIRRSLQLEDVKEFSATNFRFGLSRRFDSERGYHFIFSYQVDNTSAESVPNYIHLGTEFGFRDLLFLRLGWNKKGDATAGYGMTYGLGVQHIGFQLDYSYWNGVDSYLGGSHRISISASIGKTREQKLVEIEAENERRIREEMQRQLEQDRTNAYHSGMSQAQEALQKGELPRAFAAINKVLLLADSEDDPDFEEARQLAEQINQAIEEERKRTLDEEITRTRQETEIRQKQRLVDEHYQKALAFFESEQFREAIVECDRALELDPDNKRVADLRKLADSDLRMNITDLITRGSELAKSGQSFDALQYYNRALPLSRGMPEIESFIEGRISMLENNLEYENLIRRAAVLESENQWSKAAELYQQALRSNPNSSEIRKRYREADARANATPMPMTEEVNKLYTKGYSALRAEKYDEAILYYEQALELQPRNKTILRALDHARSQKRRATNSTESNQ